MNASEALYCARTQGAMFTIFGQDQVKVSAPTPLPESLMVELRKNKLALIPLICQQSNYAVTACTCDKTPDGTGPNRCGVCALPLICPVCDRCRGCKLLMRFEGGQSRR